MYPDPPVSGGVDGLIALLMTGGLIWFLFLVGTVLLTAYVNYRIMKAAVRNGVVEALRKTGSSGGFGSGEYVQGYPPPQTYGAPVAPHAEHTT